MGKVFPVVHIVAHKHGFNVVSVNDLFACLQNKRLFVVLNVEMKGN